jgi:RNA polymerase sigma factor (sigma-70 family)
VTPWAIISPARLASAGLLMTQSDARLVDLVRAGNDRAFEAIVLRYRRPLLRHCRRLLPAGRAEDVVQEALLRALEAMRGDERELQLGPWLNRIAQNTAIDWLRQTDCNWKELDDRVDGVEETHAAVERRARFHAVVSDIDTLPERQRRALVLRELEGRSYDEIAAALGVSGDGVRQLLNRARNAMRAAAGAVVPPALIARMAASQAGPRIAELIDPPGTALMAKATAAVAAGAVALFAMTGPPSGDGGAVPRAHAAPNMPTLEGGPGGQPKAARETAPGQADDRAGRSAARESSEKRGAGRGAERSATGSHDALAGAGWRAAADAPVSRREGEAIRMGAGGGGGAGAGQGGAGAGGSGAGGGQGGAADGRTGGGDYDDVAPGDDDVAPGDDDVAPGGDDDSAAGGGAAPDDDAPGAGGAPGGDDGPDDDGQSGAAGDTSGASGDQSASGDDDDAAPAPTARVQVTASPQPADEDDDDALDD